MLTCQTGKHMGKIVLRVNETDIVPTIPRTPQINIQENATYIIAGLGGIGREIGRWLAEKGAKTLIFLSRSAASHDSNKAYISHLRQTYTTNALAFDCDISNRPALQTVLLQITHLPRIRGCITGAMVLQDRLFDTMSAKDFSIPLRPKVQGTQNLHDLLPPNLDFFIMLSSLAGVMGHRGQGNYGAGNSFQDCFASYRRSLGLKATTIDIGYLLSVGFVAEHEEYVDHVKAMGLRVMRNEDLHGLLAIAMEEEEQEAPHPADIMCGLPFNEFEPGWYWMGDERFVGLRNVARRGALAEGAVVSLREELARCVDVDAAVERVTRALGERLARLMMIPAGDVDLNRPLSAYGVDSLVAVEVRNWIAREMLVEISVFELMANTPMKLLARDLAAKSKVLAHVRNE